MREPDSTQAPSRPELTGWRCVGACDSSAKCGVGSEHIPDAVYRFVYERGELMFKLADQRGHVECVLV